MKIGLYFGSFNPVHVGHLIIASHLASQGDLQEVWMMVSPQNPLKPSAVLLNEYQRLHLLRIAIEEDPRLKASDVEFSLPKPSYTIDTLTYLSEKYPQHQFAVIMGSDSFQNLKNWKNHQLLLSNYELYVYQRPGFSINEELLSYGGARVHTLNAPLLQISATEIRNRIQKGQSVRYLLTDPVREEIEKTGYYK